MKVNPSVSNDILFISVERGGILSVRSSTFALLFSFVISTVPRHLRFLKSCSSWMREI